MDESSVNELDRLSRLLSSAVAKLEQTAREFVDAKCDYEVARAKAMLSIRDENPVTRKITVDEVNAKATLATDTLYRKRLLAEELHMVQKSRIQAIRTAIDVVRTIEASKRVEAGL